MAKGAVGEPGSHRPLLRSAAEMSRGQLCGMASPATAPAVTLGLLLPCRMGEHVGQKLCLLGEWSLLALRTT